MSKAESRSIRRYRRHWSEELGVILVLVIASGTCLGFVRYGHLDKNPWGYVATAVAIFAAVSALVLTIAEAMLENSADK